MAPAEEKESDKAGGEESKKLAESGSPKDEEEEEAPPKGDHTDTSKAATDDDDEPEPPERKDSKEGDGTKKSGGGSSSRRNSRTPSEVAADPPTTATTNKPNKKSKQSKSPNKKSKTPSDKKRQSMASGAAVTAMTPAGGASPAPAMDVHPYARGSVIEVLYIPATAVGQTLSSIQASNNNADDDPWYWSEDSSLCSTTSSSSMEQEQDDNNNNKEEKDKAGEDDNEDVEMKDASTEQEKLDKENKDEASSKKEKKDGKESPKGDKKHHHHHHHQNAASVRLADVIDRVPLTNVLTPTGQQAWRYYVHYRDFNRRMDEWVAMDRIVAPPSVGNAKARALKKEEERMKRKQQRTEERQRSEKEQKATADIDVSAPRASRRRSSVVQQQPNVNASLNSSTHSQGPSSSVAATAAAAAGPLSGDAAAISGDGESGGEGGRRATRGRATRRKSTNVPDDDAATVVASNQQPDEMKSDKAPGAIKEVLTLNNAASDAMETTTVGEHVVATIPAQELDEHEGLDEASLREHEEITKIKNVAFIELGRHQMETWYFSPIPKELLSQKGYIEVLYICEFTFRMFARKSELQRFQRRSLKPEHRHPPGNEIYRKDNLSMFEIDGLSEKIYCQNLCYIAKLFLDHKTLYFDVDPFLFYVLCEVDDRGYHPVGYYSKEKYSDVGYNLACILTFPAQQRKGYGRFLIAFSYELSKKQEKVGGPERPVSDLGQKAYKPYWAATVIDFLRQIERGENGETASLSIMDISKKTSIMAEDIVFTLNQLGILKIINGVYFIAAAEELLEKLAKKYPVKEPRVDPSKLHWTPFLMDVKRDKFSIHSKKPNVESYNMLVQQLPPAPTSKAQAQQKQ